MTDDPIATVREALKPFVREAQTYIDRHLADECVMCGFPVHQWRALVEADAALALAKKSSSPDPQSEATLRAHLNDLRARREKPA